MSDKTDLKLDWCSYAAARLAIKLWYYRDEMPIGKLVKIGVWEQGRFSGVVIFGMSVSDALGRRWDFDTFQCCELSRLALRPDHTCQVSRVLRVSLIMLKKHCPGLRAVVSFADPQYHHGGVYQANGWLYTGTTAPDKQYRDATGRIWHSREVSPSGRKKIVGAWTNVPRPQDCEIIRIPGKHRYAMPLDEEARRIIIASGVQDAPKA